MPERESFKQVYVFTVHITIVIIPLKVLVSPGCDLKKDYLASYPFSSLAGEKKSKWWSPTLLHLSLSPKNVLKLSHMITLLHVQEF